MRLEHLLSGVVAQTQARATILKNKESSGIVTVTQGHCDGCYLVLPPEFVNKIRAGKEVQYCPNCSRVLYWTEGSQGIFSFDENEDDDDYFDTDN